jgi:hypothetical protein
MDDRNRKGQFTKGNAGGPGNPLGGTVAKLRASMIAAITPERMKEIVEALIEKAVEGDTGAAKLIFDRTLGKPLDAPDVIDRIAELEKRFEQESNNPAA